MEEFPLPLSDLSKGSLPNEGVNFIALQPALAIADDVIIVVIIVALIVHFPFLFGARIFWRNLQGSALLLGIIDLVMKGKVRTGH